MIDISLIKKSATEIAELVNTRQVSAEEVVQMFLDQIERVNPQINAFALVTAQQALNDARKVDREIAQGQGVLPLAGVPFSVKDLIPTEGIETAYGSFVMEGNIPKTDADSVTQLKKAGAILIGKSTTAEFGSDVFTNTKRYGITRNPWNTEHTSGGSSGGAAAAVAAGMGPLAINTDGGGSARIPASCCGVLGMKPTLGLVPHETWPLKFDTFTSIGANTRSSADMAAMLTAMNNSHPHDPWTAGRKRMRYSIRPEPVAMLEGLRVLYVPNMGNPVVDFRVTKIIENALAIMGNAGAKIELAPSEFEWFSVSGRAAFCATYNARFGHLLVDHRDKLSEAIISIIEIGANVPSAAIAKASLERAELFSRVQDLFTNADLIVSPTLAAPAPLCKFDSREMMQINGEAVASFKEAWCPYLQTFNLTGHPAISIPAGFADGLPVGLQAVAPYFADQKLIDLAAAIEALIPWKDNWPSTV